MPETKQEKQETRKLVESPGVPEISVMAECECGEYKAPWNGWDISTWEGARNHVPERLVEELGPCRRRPRRH